MTLDDVKNLKSGDVLLHRNEFNSYYIVVDDNDPIAVLSKRTVYIRGWDDSDNECKIENLVRIGTIHTIPEVIMKDKFFPKRDYRYHLFHDEITQEILQSKEEGER